MFGTPSKRLATAVAFLSIGAAGFVAGTWQSQPRVASAQTPKPAPPANGVVQASTAPTDYSQRVVGYIHGNIPILREEFGEFLIARHGASKIELYVNRRIIEHACKAAKVEVTPEEIDAVINDDTKQLGIDRSLFVKQYLKNYNKTLYEWKEDVIKPRLLLQKLCQSQIKVEEKELQDAFEALHGPKVQCRLIIWPKGEEKVATQMYDQLRKSEAAYASAARGQAIPALAQSGGRISPIGRNSADDALLERIAFSLKKDEVSELFVIPGQGTAVLKCDGHLPADGKVFEKEKEALHKFVFNKKVEKAIPGMFQTLKDAAQPKILMKHGTTDRDVIRAAEEELNLLNQPDKAMRPTSPAGGPAVPLPPMK